MGEDVGRAIETFPGPELDPRALRQVDVAVLDAWPEDGGDEDGVAQEELVVRCVGRLVLGVGEEEWAQDRGTRPVALLEERVEVGEEALAELDHLAAHPLVGLAEGPGLLAAGAYGCVVAAERLEDAHLCPAGEKLAVAIVKEN